jgi:isoquinoline 1-oxidoreductase beta subunit
MSAKSKISRRKFIVRGGLGAIGLMAVGTYVFRNSIRRSILEMTETLVPPYSGSGMTANLWFEVTKDNTVRLYSPKVEMGQGTFTSLAQMVADEMDLSMDQVEVVSAPTASGVIDTFSTGGSLSVAQLWVPLRELAATMREMLKTEAANKLGTTPDQLTTKLGQVSNGGESLTYAEIAQGVEEWEIPDTPELRSRDTHQFIGKPIKTSRSRPLKYSAIPFSVRTLLCRAWSTHASYVRSTSGQRWPALMPRPPNPCPVCSR